MGVKLNTVPARTGLEWVRLGAQTFLRQPLRLAGLFFMFLALASVVAVLPLLGPLLVFGLAPALNVGLLHASQEAHAGRFPSPRCLLAAFQNGKSQTRSILVLGAVYCGALVLLMLLVQLLAGPVPPMPKEADGQLNPEAMRLAMAGPRMWLMLLLYMPVATAFWHAPALVHWHGVTAGKSLFFSLLAWWSNKGAMLVFLAGWAAVVLLVGFALELLAAAFGPGPGVALALAFPTVLMLAAMFQTSIYFTCRDSFLGESQSAS